MFHRLHSVDKRMKRQIIDVYNCKDCKVIIKKVNTTIKLKLLTKKRLNNYLLSLPWVKQIKTEKYYCIECGKRYKHEYTIYVNIPDDKKPIECCKLVKFFPFRWNPLNRHRLIFKRDEYFENC